MATFNLLSIISFTLFLQQIAFSGPIFFEIEGFRTECVFDEFEEREVIQFFYEIRADQIDERRRTEVEVSILTENNDLLSSRRGYQDRVNYEIHEPGVYKICFEMVGSRRYDKTVIGIEMLGLKSESHFHQKDYVKQEHINPMYTRLVDIGGTLDEVEALQSASKNWAITYWDLLLYAQENLGFYSWLQGWILLIVSIMQIRQIRSWFAKVLPKLHNRKGHIN
eukprot:12852_1